MLVRYSDDGKIIGTVTGAHDDPASYPDYQTIAVPDGTDIDGKAVDPKSEKLVKK